MLKVSSFVVFQRAVRLTFKPKLGHRGADLLASRHQTVSQQPRENDAGSTNGPTGKQQGPIAR